MCLGAVVRGLFLGGYTMLRWWTIVLPTAKAHELKKGGNFGISRFANGKQ